MRRELLTSAIAVVVLTIVLGVVYPLVMTGVSQVVFPGRANGSLLKSSGGRVIGSRLIGQDFRKPVIGKNGKPEEKEEKPVAGGRPGLLPGAPLNGNLLQRRRLGVHQRWTERRRSRAKPTRKT